MKNFFNIIKIVFCLIFMVGFGWCGLFGVSVGFFNNDFVQGFMNGGFIFAIPGLVGLIIAINFAYAIYRISKKQE
ncbi:hypothetical protein [Undibacterium flavidum]|uniref:DUF3955 domain-containing protein n=1 Tax=Undibacterium flavidum TaxID=2762297 RepID=A0ABR6YG83_9BURK|nr:hypothetical protein [Undibacterium flavidum]MBC3875546.1 hypothetical protein [Undibacterium flavidum]